MTIPALALAVLVVPVLQQPQAGKDKVFLRAGAPIEGKVTRDTWKEVMVNNQSVKVDDILRIEYGDAPPAFRAALKSIEEEKWAEGLSALGSAEEHAKEAEKPKSTLAKPGAWFPSYLAFHRGWCLLELDRRDHAILQFDRIRKDFKESRFLIRAYELTMRALREAGDEKAVAALEAFEKEIAAAPAEAQASLRMRFSRQRAELLYDKGKHADAKKIFEQLALASDPEIQAEGTAGVIKCLQGLKDNPGVESYCKGVLTKAVQPALFLLATNALGDVAFEKKDFRQARAWYIDSVVRHNPGRTGTGIEREHERALYQLARTYEALIADAKEPKLKEDVQRMTSSAYRELAIEYPSGRFREEANAKATKYEPKETDEKKK
jgi:tetratricopeptide (TPR) repeat protein